MVGFRGSKMAPSDVFLIVHRCDRRRFACAPFPGQTVFSRAVWEFFPKSTALPLIPKVIGVSWSPSFFFFLFPPVAAGFWIVVTPGPWGAQLFCPPPPRRIGMTSYSSGCLFVSVATFNLALKSQWTPLLGCPMASSGAIVVVTFPMVARPVVRFLCLRGPKACVKGDVPSYAWGRHL